MQTLTMDQMIAQSLEADMGSPLYAPFDSYKLARLECLDIIFFMHGLDYVWVKDEDGLFRRVLDEPNTEPDPDLPSIPKGLTSEQTYQECVKFYYSQDYLDYNSENISYIEEIEGVPFDRERFVPVLNKTDLQFLNFCCPRDFFTTEKNEEVDFTKIHPDSKEALLDLIKYAFSLENPFITPDALEWGEYLRDYLDTQKGYLEALRKIYNQLQGLGQD